MLDYALARYYDSRIGTFYSADPVAGSPGDPQSWNRYAYGRNDPIDITDPSGQNWFFSLIQDIGFALSFFPPTAPLGFEMAGIGGSMNAFANVMNGQPPWAFGSFGGDMALGSSWNGAPIMQYPGLTAGLQNSLGLPTMADAVNPAMDADSVEAYHPSSWTWGCVGKGLFAAGADLTGVSMIPDADANHWRWSSAKFGFVYVEPETEQKSDSPYGAAVGGLSVTADNTEKTAGFFHNTPHAKRLLRQFLRNNDVRVSSSEFSATAGTIGKYAGRVAKVVALYDGYEAWTTCKQ